MAQIQNLSVRHETIMDFLMANPQIRLGDVATHFGVTQPWLSQVIHSDIFQARLKEKQGIAFHHTVLPLREKMTALAHMTLDKLMEQVPIQTDASITNKVAENVLDRLGFGTKGAPVGVQVQAQNVQVNILRSELDEAKALLMRASGVPQLQQLGEANVGTTKSVQTTNPTHLGSASNLSTPIPELSYSEPESEGAYGVAL